MPKTEVERWLDEIGPAFPSMEEIRSEWIMGAHQKLEGQLHQARAAALLQRHFGEHSVIDFAKEMDVKPSTVYRYSAVWRRLLEALGSESGIYQRLEHSPLSLSQIVETSRYPVAEISARMDEAEDEKLSSRAITARRMEWEDEQNSAAQEQFALSDDHQPEVIELVECPNCHEHFHINDANTWTDVSDKE